MIFGLSVSADHDCEMTRIEFNIVSLPIVELQNILKYDRPFYRCGFSKGYMTNL